MDRCLADGDFERYEAGEMADDEAARVDEHLRQCPACRERRERFVLDGEAFLADLRMAVKDGPAGGSTQDGEPGRSAVDAAPLPDSFPGYEILAEIHRGAQGVVYKAIQQSTGRTVALKVLLHGPYASRRQRRRFEREIDLVAGLEHPNIVRLYDSGQAEGLHYFAMEYIDGVPLDDYAGKKKGTGVFYAKHPSGRSGKRLPSPFSVKDTLRLFAKICRAVAFAHARGVIHRDLKPGNILVDGAGEPHVLDFGLAKPIDATVGSADTLATQTGEFFGTLAYASPEQASGEPGAIDVRTDVYALGVILYELLAGQSPYPSTGPISEVLKHITETEPRRPSRVERQLGDEVDTIVRKALDKDPDRRYQSAHALAADIERYLAGRPIEAKPYSGFYILKKTVTRHKGVASLAGVLLVCIVGFAVKSTIDSRRIARQRDRAVSAEQLAASERDRALAAEQLAKEKADAAERSLYFNRINMAVNAFEKDDTGQMKQMLAACPARLRAWEWYRLHWLSDRSLLTYTGHTGDVVGAAVSPNGRGVASAGLDDVLRVWELHTGRTMWTVPGPYQGHCHYAFSPDGDRFVCPFRDSTVRAWTVPEGKLLLTLAHRAVRSASFSRDGKCIISASPAGPKAKDGSLSVKLWDATSGRLLQTVTKPKDGPLHYTQSWVTTALFTIEARQRVRVWQMPSATPLLSLVHKDTDWFDLAGDGKQLLSTSDETIKVWSVPDGKPLLTIKKDSEHTTFARFSADGRRIGAGPDPEAFLYEWDADTGRLLARRERKDAPPTERGKWIVNPTTSGMLEVTDTTTGRKRTLRGHVGPVGLGGIPGLRGLERVVVQNRIVTCSQDNTCKVWAADAVAEAMTWTLSEGVSFAVFSPDGKRIAAATGDRAIGIWDAAKVGEPLLRFRGGADYFVALAFSPDGGRIVGAPAGGDPLRVWDAVTGKRLAAFRGHLPLGASCVAWHPDGKRIVSGSHDTSVRIWDADTGNQIRRLDHGREVGELVVSPNGKWIAVGCDPGMVSLWETRTGRRIWAKHEHSDEADGLAFSPDSRFLVAGDNNGCLLCWTIPAGKRVWVNDTKNYKIYTAVYSPDGRRVLTGGVGKISVFEAATGQLIMSWQAHPGPHSIYSLDFSPDGRNLLSTSTGDKTFKLWPAAPAK